MSSGALRVPSLSTVGLAIGLVVPLLAIGAYAGLVPLGQWQADEYATLHAFRQSGLPALWHRILYWSPRPLSEAGLFLYGKLFEATGRQLIMPFLGCMWAMFLIACFAPALALQWRTGRPVLPALVIAGTMTALFLSGQTVAEMFYWPQGAAAYMPTLAALALLLGLTAFAERETAWVRWISVGTLLVAALSSEVGAFFTVLFGFGSLAVSAAWRFRMREAHVFRLSDLQYLVPLLAAFGVVAMMANGRLGDRSEIFDPTIAHHIGVSLLATLDRLPEELALASAPINAGSMLVGLGVLVVFAWGCFGLFSRLSLRADDASIIRLVMLALAAPAAGFISLFAAYHQFGAPCCGRHESMRGCFLILAIVAGAALAAQIRLRSKSTSRETTISRRFLSALNPLAPLMLAASIVISNVWTYPSLRSDYVHFAAIRTAKASNWWSGLSSGPDMTFNLGEHGFVTGTDVWPAGSFELGPNESQRIGYLLRFFGKERVTVHQPGG